MEIIIGAIVFSMLVVLYAIIHNAFIVPMARRKKEAEARQRELELQEKEQRMRELEAAQVRRAKQREAEAQRAIEAAQAKLAKEVAAFKEKKSPQKVLTSSQLQHLNAVLNNLPVNNETSRLVKRAVKNGLPDVYFDAKSGNWKQRE